MLPRLIFLSILTCAAPVLAGVIADSKADFTGVQGANGWTYGYRNLAADGGGENFDAATAFIPFTGGAGQGAWNGGSQQFDAGFSIQPIFRFSAIGVAPYTGMGSEYTHPNQTPLHWAVRRCTLNVVPAGASLAFTWSMRKQDPGGGNGVTGALYVDGNKVDEAVISYADTIGVTRNFYTHLPAGTHRVDLVLKSRGTDGGDLDWYDATWQRLVISNTLPGYPVNPDGSLFIPQPVADTDSDGLPDVWERYHAGNLAALGAAPADYDNDGQTDAAEYAAGTSPAAGSGPVQRWSFNEKPGLLTATELKNEVTFSQKAVPKGWGLRGTGRGISMPGGHQNYAGYIDLPNGIVSRYDSCTIEGWVSVDAGGNNCGRVFDFGDSASAEYFQPGGVTGEGMDFLEYGASRLLNYDTPELAWWDRSTAGPPPQGTTPVYIVNSPTVFGRFFHFAVTVEKTGAAQSRINWWINGVRHVTDATLPLTLAQLHDVNNWLGRSQWAECGNLAGTYDEFRIYPHALTEAEVLASRTAGPDAGLPDADSDGLPDYWERNFTTPESATSLAAASDADGDGLTALQEYQNYSDPTKADTDDDSVNDGAEVTAGRLPHFADLLVRQYSGAANPGDWNTAGNWTVLPIVNNTPVLSTVVPNNTATEKFHARYDKGGEVEVSGAVQVTDLDFYGGSVLKAATGGGSITVADTLKMGGQFSGMGTVNVGSPDRGGIQIFNTSGYSGNALLQIHGTTLANHGPDGLYTLPWNNACYFSGGSRLVNEGGLTFVSNPTLSVNDGDANNAFVNRGTVTFTAPGTHTMKVNTVTEGGVWDVRSGGLSYQAVFNGVDGFHPGSVAHSHTDAIFKLAAGTSLALNEHTTTTLAGDSRIEGDGQVILQGGTLDVKQAAPNISRLVFEYGTLLGQTGSDWNVGDFEMPGGIIDFDGSLHAGEFRVPNRQNSTGITLKKVNLDVEADYFVWDKQMVPPFPVDPLPAGFTLGDGARFLVKSSQLFEVKKPLKVIGLPTAAFPLGGEFINEGTMICRIMPRTYRDSEGLVFGVPFISRGGVKLEADNQLLLWNGGELRDTGTPGTGVLELADASSARLLGGRWLLSGPNPRVVPAGAGNPVSVTGNGLLEIGAGASASAPFLSMSTANAAGSNGGLKVGAGATLHTRDLRIPVGILRGPGTVTTGAAAGDGLRLLQGGNPGGADGDTFLTGGIILQNAGPAGLIDKGFDGGVQYNDALYIDEGCSFINLPGATIEMRRGLDLWSVEHAPGQRRGGSFINKGRLVKTGGGQSVVLKEVRFANEGSLEIGSGEFVLLGRLENDGTVTVRGDGVRVDVPELGTQGLGSWRIELGALFTWGPAAILHLNQVYVDASRAYGAGPIRAGGIGAQVVATGPNAEISAGSIESDGLVKAANQARVIAPGAGGNIVAPGAGGGIVAPGAGGGIVAPGAGIVGAGAGVVETGGKIVAPRAGIVAAGAGIVDGKAGVEANGIGGNGGTVRSNGLIQGVGPNALIAVQNGGNIVTPGAGAGIVAPGAGIVAPGAGGGIIAAGAGSGIVAPGAGGGLQQNRGPRGNNPPDNITGTVQATGEGGFIMVEDGGLVEAGVKIFAGTAARLSGKGTLRAPLIHDCGALSPGSPGLLASAEPVAELTLDGDLQLEATSTFIADITATASDLAHVTGDAALAGRLQVNPGTGFTPPAAQSFTILTSSAITGTFSNLTAGRVFTADNRGSFAVAIGATTVTLTDYQPGSPAGALTFAAWRTGSGYFTAAESANDAISGPAADPDHDGFSNQLEYALGLHPREDSSASRPSLMRRADGALVFTWTRAKNITGSLFPETAADVSAAWATLNAVSWLVSETPARETWSVIVPTDGDRVFVHVKFTP